MWGTLGSLGGGLIGGIGGAFAGGPMGAMAGASLGAGVGGSLGGMAGGGAGTGAQGISQGVSNAAALYGMSQRPQTIPAQSVPAMGGVNPASISPYLTGQFQPNMYGVGVAPVMNYGLNGIDPSLAYGQYSRYSMPMAQRSA
jgi:hypothetical protein